MRRHLLFVLALLIAAPASAQDAEPAEADPAADVPAVDGDAEAEDAEAVPPPEYDARVREALQESAAGHWAEARAAFRQAHEAFPNARTERGMGMVSFEMRDYVDSVRHLRRALDNPVRPLTETQRTEVQALLDRALARIAVFSAAQERALRNFARDVDIELLPLYRLHATNPLRFGAQELLG